MLLAYSIISGLTSFDGTGNCGLEPTGRRRLHVPVRRERAVRPATEPCRIGFRRSLSPTTRWPPTGVGFRRASRFDPLHRGRGVGLSVHDPADERGDRRTLPA